MVVVPDLALVGPHRSGAGEPCPRCGEPPPPIPARAVACLDGAAVERCPGCGLRTLAGAARRPVFACEACGHPFVADRLLARGDQQCAACRNGRRPGALPDRRALAEAEAHVAHAVASLWGILGAPALDAYLDRIARTIASRIDGAPPAPRVRLLDTGRALSLALPSGTLYLSRGLLTALADEAELAFVAGHELSHATSRDLALPLARRGSLGWGDFVRDLVRLGFGRRREREADARAVEAMGAVGYDVASVRRLLLRLRDRAAAGDAELADLATAHPTPEDRLRWIDRAFYGRVPEDRIVHVNREVFRRAVARDAWGALVPVGGTGGPAPARQGWLHQLRSWVRTRLAALTEGSRPI